MAFIAHPGDTASIVSDAVGGVVDDIEEMFKQGFQFLGQGLKNAVEDSNNERCSGNCQFKWPIGGE